MDKYLKNLIAEGENQHLDFKYCVSDSKKIARTLAAFSNTEGGKLLIGVRDNGSIAGIKSDEEIYMVETAALLYCKPEVTYLLSQHNTQGKTVLEVDVRKGSERPYKAMDESGRWITWFRHRDQNLSANRLLLKLWKWQKAERGALLKMGPAETTLLASFAGNDAVTMPQLTKASGLNTRRTEAILLNLILMKLVVIVPSEKTFSYRLNPESTDIGFT